MEGGIESVVRMLTRRELRFTSEGVGESVLSCVSFAIRIKKKFKGYFIS